MERWQKKTLEEFGRVAINVHSDHNDAEQMHFRLTLSLDALKHTAGTAESCEVKILTMLEDMVVGEEVNLKLWRAFCGTTETRTVNGGVNS